MKQKQLSEAQKSALNVLRETFKQDELICSTYDPVARRYIGSPTMRKLCQLGYIEYYDVREYRDLVKNSFGRGIKRTKISYEIVYKWPKDSNQTN